MMRDVEAEQKQVQYRQERKEEKFSLCRGLVLRICVRASSCTLTLYVLYTDITFV